jgi:hypothetical protein
MSQKEQLAELLAAGLTELGGDQGGGLVSPFPETRRADGRGPARYR